MKKIILSILVVSVLTACGGKDKKGEEPKTNVTKPAEEPVLLNSDDYKNEKVGDVDFYFKNITPEESKTISDFIVKSGSFSGGSAELFITKEGDRHICRFPITDEALTDSAYMAKVEVAAKQVKDNLFADVPFSFFCTNKRYATLKAWDY